LELHYLRREGHLKLSHLCDFQKIGCEHFQTWSATFMADYTASEPLGAYDRLEVRSALRQQQMGQGRRYLYGSGGPAAFSIGQGNPEVNASQLAQVGAHTDFF
jgi:hypothetical protein